MSNSPRQSSPRCRTRSRAPYLTVASGVLLLILLGVGQRPFESSLEAQERATPAARGVPAPVPPPIAPLAPVPQVAPPVAVPTAAPIPVHQAMFAPPPPAPAIRRFQFTIKPDAPVKELLPTPPTVKATNGVSLSRSLADVPEVNFQAPMAKRLASEEAQKQTAHMLAKVNHLNDKKPEGFMEALRGQRPDLAGLPFAMGDACRIKGDRSKEFTRAVATVRNCLRAQPPQQVAGAIAPTAAAAQFRGTVVLAAPPAVVAPAPEQPVPPPALPSPASPPPATPPPAPPEGAVADFVVASSVVTHANAETFWKQYVAACAQEDQQLSSVDRKRQENVVLARVAALMQILAPEAPSFRQGLVKCLASVSHKEATQALARLAVFSEEDEVRTAAVTALAVRRERDYSDILLGSLHYPWPPVAKRGAEALVKLERTDLLPQLVELLDQPDPRVPVVKVEAGQSVHEVRELVRINHHQNCILCHEPGNTARVSPETLTAAVPVPSDPLPDPSDGYQVTSPDLSVRIDVTYLRPDFSVRQAVTDANPWPEMQRFDFLVRSRTVTDAEAAAAREKLAARDPGSPSPYQKATLAALRELTGRDAAPTAEAWRRLLNLPAVERHASAMKQ
jgi:hypothetical protein